VDEKTLRGLNSKLIYAQITGYGLEDPRAGYDAVIQAESGFQFMNGPPGGSAVDGVTKSNPHTQSCRLHVMHSRSCPPVVAVFN